MELSAVIDLWAVQLFGTIGREIRNSHGWTFLTGVILVANFLLPTPSAGRVVKPVYSSCKIHRWNLSLAVPPPTQPGQAKVFISCSVHSPACSPQKGTWSITLPHLLDALNATAGITVLWLHPKTRAVPKSLEFVVSRELMDERVSVSLTCTRGKWGNCQSNCRCSSVLGLAPEKGDGANCELFSE